jgi:hypothetical protein
MARIPNRYTHATGGGSLAMLSDAAVNEVYTQNDLTKRILLIVVPVLVGAFVWAGIEAVSMWHQVWPQIRQRRIFASEKKRLKEEFGPNLRARIDQCNDTRRIWLEVRGNRNHTDQHKRNCLKAYEEAQTELTRYRAVGVKYGISYYDSTRTVAGSNQGGGAFSVGLVP